MASNGTWGTGPCVPEGNGGGKGGCFLALWTRCAVGVVSASPAMGRKSALASSNPVSFNPALMIKPPQPLTHSGSWSVYYSNFNTAFSFEWKLKSWDWSTL